MFFDIINLNGVSNIKIIRHKTPVEESFINWINNYREGFHPCDEKRFYQFAHSIFAYKATSWLNKSEFRKKILALKPFFKEEDIDLFFDRIIILNEYNHSWQLPTITTIDSDKTKFVQRQVVNNKIEDVEISENEYNKSGISKKEFIERLNEN